MGFELLRMGFAYGIWKSGEKTGKLLASSRKAYRGSKAGKKSGQNQGKWAEGGKARLMYAFAGVSANLV